ncbi:hypothetical protein L2E82_28393 [Cichorium intybus]|uniref:Uncharacterized protein n=1 Tax=Cichorium intybus TaxID=13427 RepID=A0ACB9CVP1_CICIN|nr:hypothetical protein L2E82_28393 [Cichorium intybus]
MNPNKFPSVASSLIITAFLLFLTLDFGVCRVEKGIIKSQKLGGVRDITERGLNGVEIENLARFAVEEHNKKENSNSLLNFSRLIKAKEQVVAGKLYLLTLEAKDASGKIKVYETKIWVKPWINFKQMQEFKVSDDPSI